LIYNVAVLIGPDGEVVGSYRKVTLPRSEIDGGITPGSDYPVYETELVRDGRHDGLL
jgi:predicted amidohydrolase